MVRQGHLNEGLSDRVENIPKAYVLFKEMLVFRSSSDCYQFSALVAVLNSKALLEKDTANGMEHFYVQSL